MKKTLLSILLILIFSTPAFAEKIPVKLTPSQVISTKIDSIEVGDAIAFKVVNDVYVGEKIYLKSGTPAYGIVDFLHNNGWAGDQAEIKFKEFITKNVHGEKVIIDYPVTFNGNSEGPNLVRTGVSGVLVNTASVLTSSSHFLVHYASNVFCVFRGAEIHVEPNSLSFNVFMER